MFLAVLQFIFISSGFLSLSFDFDLGIAKHFFDLREITAAGAISLCCLIFCCFQEEKKWQILAFGFCSVCLVFLTYFSFSSSLLINKFIFVTNIIKLKANYDLLNDGYIVGFLKKTLPLHQGDSESAGASFFYMVPMYLSTVWLGGLNLFNLAVFNAVSSLFALFVFYFFTKRYYGYRIAFISVILFGSSFYFHNFARASSYLGISLLICGLFLLSFYDAFENNKKIIASAFMLMLCFHFYGPLRYLFFMPLMFFPNRYKRKKVLLFYVWFFLFIFPFAWFRMRIGGSFFDEEHVFVYANGYEYGESLVTYLDKMSAVFDLKAFVKGFFAQIIKNFEFLLSIFNTENLKVNPHHSNLLSFLLFPFLVLGIGVSVKRSSKEIYSILLFLFLCVFVLPFIITSDPVQVRRIMVWPPVIFLFIGIGVDTAINMLDNKYMKKIIFLFVALVLSLHIVKEVRNVFYFIPKRTPRLEFFYEKKVMNNEYRDRSELYKAIDDYFVQGVGEDKIKDMVFKMTTTGDTHVSETVSTVERFLPDVVLPDDNDIFFKQDFLALWGNVGKAFMYQPIKKEGLPSEVSGAPISDSFIVHTFYKQNNDETMLVGDTPVGTLTSPLFIVDKRYFSFLLGGGPTVNERVELLIDGETVIWSNSDFDEGVKKVVWDLYDYRGREARICLVDYSGRPGGFLIVADMQFSNQKETE